MGEVWPNDLAALEYHVSATELAHHIPTIEPLRLIDLRQIQALSRTTALGYEWHVELPAFIGQFYPGLPTPRRFSRPALSVRSAG